MEISQEQNQTLTGPATSLPAERTPIVPQSSSNKGLIIGLSVCVIVLIATAAYLFMQNQRLTANQSVAPTPVASAMVAASSDPLAGWQTYTNPGYGFTFRYPSDVTLIKDDSSQNREIIFSKFIVTIDQSTANLQAYVDILKDSNGAKPLLGKIESLDTVEWIGSYKNAPAHYLSTKNQELVFNVMITPIDDMKSYKAGDSELLKQIISTLQFKSVQTSGETGTVSGKLCYPSEGLPPGEIVAKNIKTGELLQQKVDSTTSVDYSFQLPEGSYHLRYQAHPSAAKPETFTSLYYTECVKDNPYGSCGPGDDHTMLLAVVSPGKETKNINLCDYGSSPEIEQNLNTTFGK